MSKPNTPSGIGHYRTLYADSITNREEFWRTQAELIKWDKTFETIVDEDFSAGKISWFSDGKLNACLNALDIHLENGTAGATALTYYDSNGVSCTYTYKELLAEVTALAGALTTKGLKTGDRIALYLPDSPESVFFMLACARLGILYVPIPVHYTTEVIHDILNDCKASMIVISPDEGGDSYSERTGALTGMLDSIIVINTGQSTVEGAIAYSDLVSGGEEITQVNCESVEAEHPLFILYAGYAAGVPRGSVFATGGFIVHAVSSFSVLFQSAEGESEKMNIACCTNLASTAGQCYGLWGALISGTGVIITGAGDNPSTALLRRILDEDPIPALLTTPRLLAALKKELGTDPLSNDRRFPLVACHGDILAPRFVVFAGNSLTTGTERVINMWIQSESGAALINTYANAGCNSPGTIGLPALGIKPRAINSFGETCRTNESGQLVFEDSWPGMIRTIWEQQERFFDLYFQRNTGYFKTNDGVRADSNGFFWFMGRLDDVIKVHGQSIATSEIESVLLSHPMVAESAVISIDGEEDEDIIAYVVIELSSESNYEKLVADMTGYIKRRIGEFAVPVRFIVTEELPRTRTGKIVRRLLRRIADGTISPQEDLSHVANPHSVDKLINKV